MSNPQSSSSNACNQISGLNKYVQRYFAIGAGLIIYNDPALTTKTFNTDIGGQYVTIFSGSQKYAVNFDNDGVVYSSINCS